MRFGGVPFGWVERQVAGAVRRGASFDRLMSDSLIELRHGDDRDIISPMHHLLLALNTVVSAGDAAHALARRSVDRHYPEIGVRLFLGCSTLEGAIQALARFYASAGRTIGIRLITQEDTAVVSIHIDADDPREAAIIEDIYLVWIFMHFLRFFGRAPTIHGVTVRHPSHFNLGRRHWGVGAPVAHADATTLRFPRRLLAEGPTSPAGDHVQWECHQLWLDFLDPGAAAPLDAFVSNGDFVRFSDVAREAGVSTNTLRRQTSLDTGGFRHARQTALVQAAVRRLRTSEESVEAIAADLGYSDARSLRRFLKTATGLTPQQVRAEEVGRGGGWDPRALEKVRLVAAMMDA